MSDPNDDKAPYLEAWMRMGITFFGTDAGEIEGRRVVSVVRRMLATVAMAEHDGNATKAADRIAISRRQFDRWFKEQGAETEDAWEDEAMAHAMDDSLFPLIRIRWPHDADATFANALVDWSMANVLPRAEAENTKVVELLDWAALGFGLPSIEVLTVMKKRAPEFLPLANHIICRSVVFSPKVFLGNFLGPLFNLAPWTVKLTTKPKTAIELISEAFAQEGIPFPGNITI